MMARRLACTLLVLAVGLGVMACDPRPPILASPATCRAPFRAASGAASRSHPAWIISAGALSRLLGAGLPRPLFRAEFDRPGVLVLVSHGEPDSLVRHSTPTFYFTSTKAMERALRANQVPAVVRYLLVDLERWPLTPAAEQKDPIGALKAATTLAHKHGKCVIFAPAVDLVGVTHPGLAGTALYAEFNQLLAGPGAGIADLLAIQAQHTEGTRYAGSFAAAAIQAARAVRPAEPVLVGLSTNPGGRKVSPGDMLALYRSGAASAAAGYWLNIPQAGPECPGCGYPQTPVAVAFLKALAR
jgi:hypothetical protein